jgi:hypothetical protein
VRYFAKFKDPDVDDPKKAWRKVPGGAIPASFDYDAAVTAAIGWYEGEMAQRKLARAIGGAETPTTWPELCDRYVEELGARVRGAASTRVDLKKLAKSLRLSNVLASRALAAHDDKLALVWLRQLLIEPSGRTGEPRDALTVRSRAAVVGYIYEFAQRIGAFPQDRRLPTDAPEFKAEIAAALEEKKKLGRVASRARSRRPRDRALRPRLRPPQDRDADLRADRRPPGRAPRAAARRPSTRVRRPHPRHPRAVHPQPREGMPEPARASEDRRPVSRPRREAFVVDYRLTRSQGIHRQNPAVHVPAEHQPLTQHSAPGTPHERHQSPSRYASYPRLHVPSLRGSVPPSPRVVQIPLTQSAFEPVHGAPVGQQDVPV